MHRVEDFVLLKSCSCSVDIKLFLLHFSMKIVVMVLCTYIYGAVCLLNGYIICNFIICLLNINVKCIMLYTCLNVY